MKQAVCRKEELGPGQMRTVMRDRVPVVVLCTDEGRYYALRGICPHQGAELGKGHLVSPTTADEPGVYAVVQDKKILRCPWHSFDYDTVTGQCLSDSKLRVKTYPVHVENGHIVIDL